MSTIDGQLNWGASYFVNDFYKRFIRKEASDRHYLLVSRLVPLFLAAGAMVVAFRIQSIYEIFNVILNFTAGIGPVYLLRWFWWRINPWSEIAAMTASLPVLLLRPFLIQWLGVPSNLPLELVIMIFGTALVWLPATFLTSPSDEKTLKNFFDRVRPPGFWRGWERIERRGELRRNLLGWALGLASLFSTTYGLLEVFIGNRALGAGFLVIAAVSWWFILRYLGNRLLE
jgi:hypothetical protein